MASKRSLRGGAIIGQSGGPTVVINQSLVGAVLEARRHEAITRFLGMRHGVKGVLERDLVDLSKESEKNLEAVAATPAAALGSVRKKPTEEECARIFATLRELDVRYYFYVGGNDSAETAEILHGMAKKSDHAVRVFHVPKTIDNDLRVTDHCPGFGSAARFVAQAFMGDDLDNRSLPGVKINVVMGRNAGFLTAASALARVREDSGPHLIYVPERPFSDERFSEDVKAVLAKHGRCVVAASEGIAYADGRLVAEKLIADEADSHGNARLSGTGALGDYLSGVLKGALGSKLRVRADTLGYMQRSFVGVVSESDAKEARRVGAEAVKAAVSGIESGSISILREPGPRYKVRYEVTPLNKVARVTKHMPDAFLAKGAPDVTKAWLDYAAPLVGKLPAVGFLAGKKVAK